MEASQIFKVLLAVGGLALWAYRQLKAKEEQPAPTAMSRPPPIPRRVRRPRAATKPVMKAAEEPGEGPVRPPPTVPVLTVVPSAASATPSVRARFRGTAALRRAVVAREVLGPPLCLRPPRF